MNFKKSIKLLNNFWNSEQKESKRNLYLIDYYYLIFIYLFLFFILYLLIDLILSKQETLNPRAWDFLNSNIPEKADIIIFFISFAILPAVTYLCFLIDKKKIFSKFTIYFVSCLSILLIFDVILVEADIQYKFFDYKYFLIFLIFSIFLNLFINKRTTKISEIFIECAIILLVICILIYKPYFRFETSAHLNFYYYITKDKLFITKYFIITVSLFLYFFFLSRNTANNNLKYIFIIFIPTFIFLSLDIEYYSIDLHHYIPYVGPSLFINQGGIAGVDVFSQYGLGVSFLNSIFFKFAPNTFFSFGLLVRIINFFSYLFLFLIIFKISNKKFFSIFASLLLIILHITTMSNNMNAFPSTFGTRYFLPLIILYFISDDKFLKLSFNLLIVSVLYSLSSLWSLECFVYANALIISNLAARALFYKKAYDYLYVLGFLILIFIFFHLIINTYYFLNFGKLLNYYLLVFISLKAGAISKAPQIKDFLGWLPFVICYSLVLIQFFNLVLKKYLNFHNNNKLDLSFNNFLNSFFNLSVFGIIIGIYYVNRSVPLALYFLYFPLFLIIYKFIEMTLTPQFFRKKLFIVSFFILVISLITTRGVNLILEMRHPNEINKYQFIKNCLFQNCDYSDYIDKKKILINTPFFDTNYPTSMKHYENVLREAMKYKLKYFNGQNRNLIFISIDHIPLSEMLFMYTNSWYFHPISWIFSDSTVKKIRENIFNFNKNIKEDQLIMFYDSKELHHFEKEIVNKIRDSWKFCLIEKSANNVSVYKLRKVKCNV